MNVVMVVKTADAKLDIQRHMPWAVTVATPGMNLLGHKFQMVLVLDPMTTPAEREWFDRMFPACLTPNADMHPLWDERAR